MQLPFVGQEDWRRAWQPTPVFLPRESHGQRSLVGYSPLGCKELDRTEETQHENIRKIFYWLYDKHYHVDAAYFTFRNCGISFLIGTIVALQCCQLLPYNKVNQLYVCVYIYTCPHIPSWTAPRPPRSISFQFVLCCLTMGQTKMIKYTMLTS